MQSTIARLNETIRSTAGMTTATIVIARGRKLLVGQVGDSAVYDLQETGARRLTSVQAVGSRLTQALGMESPQAEFLAPVLKGRGLLACTDGLAANVEEFLLRPPLEGIAVHGTDASDDATGITAIPS